MCQQNTVITETGFNWYSLIKDFLPPFVAAIAMYVSLKALSNTKREKRVAFMTDVDKQLIDNPRLWTMFDNHFLINDKTKNDQELRAKIDGLCYLILNNLEVAYNTSSRYSSAREAWKNYYVDLCETSTKFKAIAQYSISKRLYSKKFLKFLTDNIPQDYNNQ